MSIDRFTRLYHLYTKKKNILIRSFIRVCILVFLIGICSIVNAQTPCVAPYNPTPASTWGMVQKFQTSTGIWNGGTPTAADLNGDGISEILVPASDNSGYFVYKGDGSNATTGKLDFQISIQSAYSSQPAIANIISTSAGPEVIAVNASGYVYIFASTGGTETNYLYKSTTASQYTTTSTPYVVDIDGDGKAEIVLGSDIFGTVGNALVKRVAGPALGYVGQTSGSTGTPVDVIVADILSSNPGKEIIYGSRVYGVNLTTGVTTKLKDLSTIVGSSIIAANDNGPTAVGDMNGDGKLDIVYNGSSFVVMWDPNGSNAANTLLFRRIPPSFNYGTRGLPLIANVFNDITTGSKSTDLPEAVIINSVSGSAGIVTAYNLNYNTTAGTATQHIWSIATNDMSGCTGITAFDFDGNGIREIVYRDQSTLRIINGNRTTPVNYATADVASSTWGEYPIVADLNNDGQAEIAVTGNNMLQVFGSNPTTFPWRAAPNYWNQRNYRIVNINSNLTIPTTEINAASLVAYNNNAAQFQFADAVENGVASGNTNSADAQITINTVTTNCPTITVAATISNTGSYLLPAGTFVAMYDANPTSGAANLIGTFQTTATIAAGGSMNVTMTANLVALSSNVFAVVNDRGTTARPFNLSSWTPNTGFNECSYTNNIDSKTFTCLDTDGDNVVDYLDIDDDNDGILDAIESPTCFYTAAELSLPIAISTELSPYSTNLIGRAIDGNATTLSAFDPSINWVGKELFKLEALFPIPVASLDMDLATWALSSVVGNTFKLQGSNDNNVWTDLSTAQNSTGTTGTYSLLNTVAPTTKYKYFRVIGVAGVSNYGGVTEIRFNIVNSFVQSQYSKSTCLTGRTDGDLIPNHLDLDSDGDGCSDALEAGTTTSTTTNFKFTGTAADFGANGFYNSLEKTAAESNLYSGIYTYDYATDNAYNCTDTDGDGISNLIDLDDDNDGILDAVESPTCFYTLEELSNPASVSSELTQHTASYVIGNSIDRVGTTASAFTTGQDWVGKEIFKFTAKNFVAISGMSFDLVNWPLSSASTSTFKLQGSGDNQNWTDLSTVTFSSNTTGAFTISNTLAATTKFKYFRLLGVAGTSGYGGVYEAKFTFSSLASPSANPKPTCTNDTDGDGKLNQNDLDSDGDGCSDAVEAGTAPIGTTAFGSTSFFNPATTGANGFANSLETATESGIYSGTYKYVIALSSALSACLDTDGDGVSNIYDIDDDNDGITDLKELNCTLANSTDGTCTDALKSTFTYGIFTHCSGWYAFDFDPSPSVIVRADFDYMGVSGTDPYFDLQGSYTTPLTGKMVKSFATTAGLSYTFEVDLISVFKDDPTTGSKPYLRAIDASTGEILGTTYLNGSGVRTVSFTGIGSSTLITLGYDIGIGNIGSLFWKGVKMSQNGEAYQICSLQDTDNDGVPNQLDLDSDGDACPDAVEAGTTAISSSGVASSAKLTASIIPAPYGNNGFANGLETASESGLYTGTYTYNYAIDATISGCKDTDGDGVTDVIDLDDDNDGVLDTIEDNCTIAIVNKTGLIITKPSTINYTFNANTISNLIDGVDNSVYVIATPTGTLNGPWLNFEFPSPKALTYLEIGHYPGQLLFSKNSTYKIQGSSDNTNWTDVSGTLTYNNVATSTSGGLSTTISNIANFSSNKKAYKYYRILGIDATVGAGWATEIYFKEFTCAIPDLDGDGIPNRLDLDSDGDGCPDAVEARSTAISTSGVSSLAKLTTSIIPAPYGNNGFANGLETTLESGLYTGTYAYNYAIDATISGCKDSDGDGVPDVLDIDDDNDGVLDSSEQINCVTSGIDLTTLTYNGSSISAKTANSFTTAGGDTWKSSYSNENLKLPISLKFKHNSTTGYEMFGLFPITKTQTPLSWDDGGYKFYPQNSVTYGYFTGAWDFGAIAISSTDVLSIDISATGYVTAAINGVTKKAFQGVVSDYKLAVSSYRASSLTDIILTDATRPVILTCTELDTDKDGIPNRLDLDSDGDGCPDAVESGATAITNSGVASSAKLTATTIPAPYGNNGFANGLETASESGAYSGTYTYNFVTDATLNSCLDTDGDGVPNVSDLDDDNDGILDTEECNVTLLIDQNTANAGLVSRKSWTLAYIIEQDVNSFAGTTFGALRAEATQNVYGEVKLPPASTTVFKEAITTLDFPSMDLGTVIYREVYVKIPSTTAFKTATQISFRVGKDNLTWNAADLYVSHNGASITAATPAGGGGGSTSVLVTTNRNDLKLVSQGKFSGTGGPYYQGGAFITSPTNAGKWVRIALSIQDGAQNEQAGVQYSLNGSTTWLPVDVANGFKFSATEFNDGLDGVIFCDTDDDGIPNSFDLDSDGDGCPDAKEAGVNATLSSGSVKNGTGGAVTSTTTVANAIAAGPYGNNGLANGVETSTESGVVTYTSTYALNALVKDLVAPTITTQPLNRTVFIGTAAVLTTTAAAPPANRTLTYQWYKAGVPIAGATSATYTVTSAAISSTSADYYCSIGFVNSCFSTNTNTVNITVLTNPVGLTACQDGSAVLSVTKTGTNAVTYQWRKATANLVNGAKIAGATTTSLTLTNLALADAGAYTLVATDANGAVITSLTGTITITNNTKYVLPTTYATCATISTINLSSSVLTGTSGATSAKWQRSTDGGNTWADIVSSMDGVTYTNFTTATLGITAANTTASSSLNGYQYRIASINASCINYSNVETITINSAPTITAQPSNSVLCNVFGTSFTAAATGANLTYKWQTRAASGTWTTITASNASTIDAGVVYSNFATTTLNLSAAPATENNNEYQVVFTNSCGTVTSTTAVLNPTVATPTLNTNNIAVCEGTAITLTTTSTTATTTYQWYLAGTAIGGATNNTYNPTSSGNYSVVANATGYCSSGTASATVSINTVPIVAIAQGAVLTLSSGTGGIDLTASVSPSGTYNYTWYKAGSSVSGPASTNVYTVGSAGSYTVRATNTITNCFATSPATTITVLPAATVNGNSAICADGSVSMSVALAAGQTIQWESSPDGTVSSWTPIAGANSATYNATPTNITSDAISITYRAVISAGTNTTTAATGTTNAIVVTANPIPTAIISNTASGTTLCAGTNAILTASSGAASATYQWYNNNTIITGATASTYTATSSGNYSFKVTDISCDCSANSISSTVTVVSPPAAPNLTATSKIICINTTADLTVFQPLAIAGVSYEWHSASNTLSSTLVANASAVGTAGTYYLFAKNNTAGCFSNASVPFTLSIVSVTQATLTGASSPTYTVGDIAVGLNASTSNPTYSLRWYAASTGGVALNAPVLPSTATAGITNYYVEQYDATSSFCTSNPRQLAAVTVKPLAPIVANITYCENATAVALTATPATGGTLNWYGTAATGGTLTTTATIPATGTATNTTYYVSQTVNGVEGARAALTVSINAAPSIPSSISGTFSVTSTNSYTYSVTSEANTTYQWTFPPFMSGTSTTNSRNALVNTEGSGTINVIAINANGCLSPVRTVNVSAAKYVAAVPVTINTSYTIGDPSNPANTASQITAATDATLNFYTSNAAGSASTSEQAIPATAGVYTYYVSQTINGVESALVPYTVTIKPQKPIIADITSCQNDVPVALTATGTALQWYTVSTSGTATSTAPTPSTGTATTTTYYITQTVNGVESDRIALVVTINPTPDIPSVISGNTTTSTQSSEIYSVINDISATGYVWILPNGWSGTSSVNSITATVGLSGGQIKVKAINGSCASPFSTLTVDILNVTNPPLTTDITFITGSTPSNIASNTTALITGTASTTLNFYTSNEAGTETTTAQTTPTTPGVYTYYVSQTSSIGVESILVPYTITVKPIAPPINTNNGIVGNAITYCKGASAFALTATISSGGTLKWYTVATGGSPSISAPTPSTSLVGTSNYYVAQVVNGVESDRVLIVVTVNDAPGAVTATATQPTCTNSSGYIVITAPLGTGFTYSVDGSNYTNTTLFSALPAGIYYATAKNNFGCVSAPTPITINMAVAPPLSPLVTVTQPTCASATGSITILSSTLSTDNFSIDGGLNYQASKIFTGIAPGTYTVTTLNAGGCVSAGTTAIVNAALPIPAQPSISSSSASANICAGNTVTLTSSALTGNQWYKDGVLIAGAINQNYAPNESGNYTVIATNASGCASIPSDAQTITFNPLPIPVISNGATLAFDNCTTTVITLTASNTNTSTGNSYQWYLNGNSINVGGNNSTYNANQAGNYSVVITNNGCSVTSAISKLIAAPSVNAANTAFCEGGSSLISGISTGFTNPSYQWRVSTNDGLSFANAIGAGTNSLTYTATTAGKYQLQVTDGGIVSTSCPINVTVFTNPTATITASPSAAVCVGSTISLNATVASGTASYTYQWLLAGGNDIAGAALSSYTTGVAGSYAVKVTDANGCVVNAAPSTISFNAVPTAPVVTITNPTCEVATGTISVTSPLGVGYTYSIDGTNYSNTTGLFTGVTPGLTYNVTVKSSTGCTSNATVATIAAALVVPAQPVITGPANIIPFSLNTYSVAAVPNATSYSWNIPGYWSGVSTTNTITIKVDASAGSLTVTANSANCVSVAATKNITATLLSPDVNVTNISVPVSGKLTTNDIVPAGTTYGQPGTNAANPSGASITVNANGSYTFTATTPGKYIFYVPVCAAGQTTGCPVSPLEITVVDPLVNTDNPIVNNDFATVKSGTPSIINVLANDAAGNSDGTLNASSLSITSTPKHGVAVVNSDGTITYSSAAGFIGTDSLVYNICDNSSPTPICQVAVAYFKVLPTSAPSITSAVDDYASILSSPSGTNAVSGNVLTNDINSAGTSLTATVVAGPTNAQGSFTMNANGSYTFTPTANFSGPVDITYTACTGATPAACATATIHILVEASSVINSDVATAYINLLTTGNISTNDILLSGTTYSQPTQQSGATITVNPNGTYSFTATEPGTYTYTIPVCAPGQTTSCPTQTLVITVPVNTLVDNTATAYINVPSSGNISSNDVVPAGTSYGQPAQQTGATITMNTDGTYSFTATVAGTYTYTVTVCAPGQTTGCPTETLVITVPSSTIVNDAATAYINVPSSGNISSNDVVPAGTSYGQPAQQTGATITINADGTYSFTATAPGTYTYTVPVCAPGQTTGCPTETLVITVPVNTLVDNTATAYTNIPTSGNISTNDAVPSGTSYGQPAQQTGATITINTDGTYSFTATAPGTYTYSVPVCAPGQTTNCPTEKLVITVSVKTIVDDTATAFVNISIIGNISTNDAVPAGSSYGQPAQQTGASININANGTYSFTATSAGTYTYTVPVCAPGQTTNCPTETLVITVIGNQPQGTINLKYNTLLASDSVHVKLKVYDGVGPYTMIFKNSINSRIDTVKNLTDSTTILLPPSSNDAVFTLLKIIDNNNSTRIAKFDKDTARLIILKPKILLTLKAELPTKLPDNSFKTNILMKIKNNGGLYLQNVQVDADLSKVFPPDMQFVLDSVKVTSGNLTLNKTYTGFGFAKTTNYVSKVVNGFTIKYRSFSTLSGSDLFDNGVNLGINEEGSVVFYLTLKPGLNIDPLVLQFTSAGDGLLVQKDGNKSMQPTTSISHDNSNINAHPLVTTIGKPLPTYIPFFLVNEIGASLDASQPVIVNGGYVFSFKSIIKNYSNSNLDSVAASFDINQFIKSPDAASIYGTPTVVGTTSFNPNFDGKNDIQLFKGVSQLKVGDSIKIVFDLFVKTDKIKIIWPTYLNAKGITTTGDLKVTDTSTNGSNPDPNGNKIPNESVRTLIGIGIDPPPAPEVIAAVYEVDDKRNPKNISPLIKKIPVGTVPTWCNVDGSACSINPPILPNIVGTYIWCVKSLDTITGLKSTPCVYDTVRIIPINKYSKYDIIKSAKNIEYDLSGRFIVGFNMKVVNNTDRQIDYILIQDDLTSTFKRADGFKLLGISSSGTLVTNYNFNGISNIEMLQPESYLKAYSTDSIIMKILIESESIEGDFNNAANMKIRSDYGVLDLLSNDTVVNKNGLTNRVATKFKVPKIELNIPGGFSPNNDGIDDTWKIQRPFGTKISVQVFNRWGNAVYANDNYVNDWRGIGVNNFMGENVVEGTYFYIVLATDRDGAIKKFAGSLTIVR